MENIKRTSGKGSNTLSFDPKTSIQRPDMRIIFGDKTDKYEYKLTHVVIIKHFFEEPNLYSKLLDELKEKGINESDYIEWHEGSHLITKTLNYGQGFHVNCGN